MRLVVLLLIGNYVAANSELPIIGILAQEAYSVAKYFPNENYTSFISATYVKYVEAAGARAVPVWIGQDRDYYRSIVNNTNGLLLPGGAAWFNVSNGYYDAGKILYEIAEELNQKGDYYPILGICLGMELLAIAAARGKVMLTHCDARNIALPLEFKEGFRYSKLFNKADETVIKALEHDSITYNNHMFCVTPESFISFGLSDNWKIISTSADKGGTEFISIFESKRYPYYGLQFHPERNIFGHTGANIPRSENAIKASQYFTNFFVFESRRNNHGYSSWEEEHGALIYNYNPIFLNLENALYEQLYVFK